MVTDTIFLHLHIFMSVCVSLMSCLLIQICMEFKETRMYVCVYVFIA